MLAIFALVKIPIYGLHANMQQRQRLKNLDRFKSNVKGVLVATDVAARGLDIQGIEHVVHYQLPRDADTFVHRSGRTARANTTGLSLALASPDDVPNYKRIIFKLYDGKDIPVFPVERSFYPAIKRRFSLAKQIDDIERKQRKAATTSGWFEKAAMEMDMELDDDLKEANDAATERAVPDTGKLKGLRAKLNQALSEDITHGPTSRLVVANKHMKRERALAKQGARGAALAAASLSLSNVQTL